MSGLFGLGVGAVVSYSITGDSRALVKDRETWGIYAALVSLHALTVGWICFLAGLGGRSLFLLFTVL